MRRYWLSKGSLEGDQVTITGPDLHHVRDVCRLHVGSKFEVIIEGGHALLVEITSESKSHSTARVLETRKIPELARPHIHLAISMPRFPVFEAVLEKSVELGVKTVRPFFSDFSFIRKQEDLFQKKRERFEKIVVSATQQSGRGDLMPISAPLGLEEMLQTFNREAPGSGLFAYEGQGVLNAKEGLLALKNQGVVQDVWLFAGSEGGFSGSEVQLFQSFGLKPVTLGSQVLRVETACVALISVIKYDFDLMR